LLGLGQGQVLIEKLPHRRAGLRCADHFGEDLFGDGIQLGGQQLTGPVYKPILDGSEVSFCDGTQTGLELEQRLDHRQGERKIVVESRQSRGGLGNCRHRTLAAVRFQDRRHIRSVAPGAGDES
jgi:hypothetical protein